MQRSVIKEEACEKQVRVVRLLLGPPTLGPKETSFRTHSTVNMVVKMRFRSLRMSMNSSGAPWNWNNWNNGDTPTPKMSQSISSETLESFLESENSQWVLCVAKLRMLANVKFAQLSQRKWVYSASIFISTIKEDEKQDFELISIRIWRE